MRKKELLGWTRARHHIKAVNSPVSCALWPDGSSQAPDTRKCKTQHNCRYILQQEFLGYTRNDQLSNLLSHSRPFKQLSLASSIHHQRPWIQFPNIKFLPKREVIRTILYMQRRSSSKTFSSPNSTCPTLIELIFYMQKNLGFLREIHRRQKCLWATFDCVAASEL